MGSFTLQTLFVFQSNNDDDAPIDTTFLDSASIDTDDDDTNKLFEAIYNCSGAFLDGALIDFGDDDTNKLFKVICNCSSTFLDGTSNDTGDGDTDR